VNRIPYLVRGHLCGLPLSDSNSLERLGFREIPVLGRASRSRRVKTLGTELPEAPSHFVNAASRRPSTSFSLHSSLAAGATTLRRWVFYARCMSPRAVFGVCRAGTISRNISRFSAERHGKGVSVSGIVRDDDTHQVLSSVTLDLQRSSGESASTSVITGTRGEFQFDGIVSGDYFILAHQKGYEPASLSIMLGGIPLSNVTVT
jgi:hypothetical protein